MTKVKIVNKSGQPVPAYATPLSAGMDLRACLDAPVTLGPLERTLVPTGLFIALPAGFEAQVRPRSGLAAKHGITVLTFVILSLSKYYFGAMMYRKAAMRA